MNPRLANISRASLTISDGRVNLLCDLMMILKMVFKVSRGVVPFPTAGVLRASRPISMTFVAIPELFVRAAAQVAVVPHPTL